MLTRLKIRRFKRFGEFDIALGNPVVFIGPNNSGKTSALQALALWSIGVRKWVERREGGKSTKRTGVTINRRDLVNIPLNNTYSLWRELRVRKGNDPLRLEITVEGTFDDKLWSCGMEFETVDRENIRCRPMTGQSIPDGARTTSVAFLPPMSGLIAQEDLLQIGSIERRIGEGRTAEILRNLCYQVYQGEFPTATPQDNGSAEWHQLVEQLHQLFGVKLQPPTYYAETGVLTLSYLERDHTELDLIASGQGFRQTLLLLGYLYLKPNTVLLLDEPDAHLEILRQRQIYQVLADTAHEKGNQIVIATHSEVILNEAAQRDMVIAFLGNPHRITKEDQVKKALATYGYEHYYQAEQLGWVLYLEGATDLAILRAFARQLNHPAATLFEQIFVHYVQNQPGEVFRHFYGLREAFPHLIGIALYDRLERPLDVKDDLPQLMWERREIENYFAFPETLVAYAVADKDDLFSMSNKNTMQEIIELRIPPIALKNREDVWWADTKMSDQFLTPVFNDYFQRLGIPNLMRKSDFHQLAPFVPTALIPAEVGTKLDAIWEVAKRAVSFAPPENLDLD